MNESPVISRYAKALFELAKEKNILEDVKTDISNLLLICSNNEMNKILQNPTIKNSSKINILTTLLKTYGSKNETISFIELLINKNREILLPDMARNFMSQYNKAKNIKTAYVTSVTPLTKDMEDKIQHILKNSLKANIEIKKNVDTTLIGGFTIRMQNFLYDFSIKQKLTKIKQTLLNAD